MSLSLRIPPTTERRHVPAQIRLREIFDFTCATFLAAFLVWQVLLLPAERPEMWDVAILFAINGSLAVVGIAVSLRRGYPIFLACFYFDYLFFSIAPLQQIRVKFDPIFGDEPSFYKTIFLCLAFTAIAMLALACRSLPHRQSARPPGVFSRTPYTIGAFHPLILFATIAVTIMMLLALYGSTLVATREATTTNVFDAVNAKAFYLLITGFLNSFVFVGACIGLLGARANRHWPWMIAFALLLIGAEFINNPLVTARFRASALLVFAMLAFTHWNNTRMLVLFMFSALLATPVIELFRVANAAALNYRPIESFFAHMDYDAFAMTNHVVRYIDQTSYLSGTNLITSLLFFVPRAIWPDKAPLVASYVFPEVRYYRNVGTDNLSSPPMAEGYVDLGLIGALLLTAAVFAVFTFLERRAQSAQKDAPLRLIVCITPMLAIILLRGPFIVGYSELCSNITAIVAAILLLRLRLRWGSNKSGG